MIRANDERGTRRARAFAAAALLVCAAGLLAAGPAEAAFPGENGRIVFASDRTTGPGVNNPEGDLEIYSMRPGDEPRQLTANAAEDNEPALSADGKQVAFHTDRDGNFEIYTASVLDGTQQTNRSNNTADELRPAFSPDGKKLAFESTRTGNPEIFTTDLAGANQTNVSNNAANDLRPAFSPDGEKIAFQTDRTGDSEIFAAGPDGANPANLTNNPAANEYDPNWHPDTPEIAFTTDRHGNNEIYVRRVDGTAEWRITAHPASDVQPAFSPDGLEITFSSTRDGNFEVYVYDQFGNHLNATRAPAFDVASDWGVATPDFVVTNTDDSGAGSLRQAITDANANSDSSRIGFDIPGTGVRTISPTAPLPRISARATIDGYTQPGTSPNTLAAGKGNNAKLLVELDGSKLPGEATGLLLDSSAPNGVVRGLVVNRFGASGLHVSANSARIEGNFIGTDATGTVDLGNGGASHCGVAITGSFNKVGGGPLASNVISGNLCGISISEGLGAASAMGNGIYGNYLGTTANGEAPLPNDSVGVGIHAGTEQTDVAENVIARNGAAGVLVDSGRGASINGNSIHSNGGLGIDLGGIGVDPNDGFADADDGANGLQNYPEVTSVSVRNGVTTVSGTLHSAPETDYLISLYSSPERDPSGFGEGRTFQRTASVRTDSSGNASFTLDEPESLGGQFVTLTAASEVSFGTSEFSRAVLVDVAPPQTAIVSGPVHGSSTRSTSASFAFASTEAGSSFECSLDHAAFVPCPSPKAYSGLASRAHTLAVRARDGAGNVDGSPAVRTWTVDTVRPTVPAVVPAQGARTRDATPLISATVRDSQTNLLKANIQLFVDGRAVTRFSYNSATDRLSYASPTLRAGTHAVTIVARDRAGNVAAKRWSFSVAR